MTRMADIRPSRLKTRPVEAIMGGMEPEFTEDEIADLLDDQAEDDGATWDDEYEWTTR
jgi:hypothetical protein